MQGWIKLHRKLMASDVFQNEKLLKVFIYCLLKATHSDFAQKVGRQTVHLKPGQFVYGRKKAALELNMKESTVRDYINILKDDGVITINPTNKFSVITVVNWDLYQSKEETPDNKYDSNSDNKPTTEGQQKDTNKNEKNEKNNKEDITTTDSDPIDLIADKYSDLRTIQSGRPSYPSTTDYQEINAIISMGIPVNRIIEFLTQCFEEYNTRNPNGQISSFKYCKKFIVDRYQRELARDEAKDMTKDGAGNVIQINWRSPKSNRNETQPKQEPLFGNFVGRYPKSKRV